MSLLVVTYGAARCHSFWARCHSSGASRHSPTPSRHLRTCRKPDLLEDS